MSQLKCNEKEKIHFVWFIILMVCVVITYCYQKSKATDNYNKTLQAAASNCNLEIVKLLVKDMAPNLSETALHCAARKGCLDIIRFLILEEKVNINVIDRNAFKRTALHHAAGEGHLGIVRFLLEKGANPNIKDNDGKGARKIAVMASRHDKNKPYREIIKLLANAEEQHKSK
ncbi:ankyrin repeat domain protein [Wolbachia endosymbiont of Culex quinquefasciatus JHB]|uniref:ankyrin repeat domain-containing protein n=1 Tax=unclassified Wolbachia TaxID=2640676 RepID=UPI00017620CE|nr:MULTISPECIES: ankyrin repeat domain-containing protein [unclassified Wolbachia]EEB56066.1 ankyrin repeat domain protein [Wolbachia endosymbiont of Culex quinquefasciatus JHB]CAQ55444.1 ankyrin repeat domain protein [Wolbachia endosymbiont of Culex quinquefasciatus Pel]